MAIILHITSRSEWSAARAAGIYRPESLATEGFVHCSTATQAMGSANKYFRGRSDLLLLCIDEDVVSAEIRYEPPAMPDETSEDRSGDLFPHIYGPLELEAVIRALPLPCDSDGCFTMPADASAEFDR